jgi:hypothetical protein
MAGFRPTTGNWNRCSNGTNISPLDRQHRFAIGNFAPTTSFCVRAILNVCEGGRHFCEPCRSFSESPRFSGCDRVIVPPPSYPAT